MYQPLEDAAFAFADARDTYIEAAKTPDDPDASTRAVQALISALAHADAILSFLGFIDPYECGECPSCKAKAAARRDEMQAAVDADPVLSPTGPLGPHLTPAEEALARKLLAEAFGTDADADADDQGAPE